MNSYMSVGRLDGSGRRVTSAALRDSLSSFWGCVERFAGSRWAKPGLFLIALGVYGLESVAWPLSAGRDLSTYLRFYEQMWDWHALLPASQLVRTPVAPLVTGGLLDLGGGRLAETAMAALFAGSIVAWATTALAFGRRAAVLMALALLFFPAYGALFHEFSSDAVFAAGFALWVLLVVRAARAPSAFRFVVLGLGIALLALIRPGNQVLVVVVFLPLLLNASWRKRLVWGGACLCAAVICLAGWAGLNDLRYDDFTVARSSNANVPFYRVFAIDRIVSPENGPASKKLAAAVKRDLLPVEPYRSYGIDVKRFFSSGSTRMYRDLIGLSDRVWGWHSDDAILRRVAFEAIQKHPDRYLRGVGHTVWSLLRSPVYGPRSQASGSPASAAQARNAARGGRLPKPTEGEPIPAAHQSAEYSTPDNRIRVVWTSPVGHRVVFSTAHDQHAYEQLKASVDNLLRDLPTHSGNDTLSLRLNQVSHRYPWPAVWLGVGLLAALVRRPRRASIAGSVAAAALLVIVSTALGEPDVPEYAAPVVPAFVLVAAVGLLGDRSSHRA